MTQSQPPITNTAHTLRFDKLSPRDCERVRVQRREAERQAEHLFQTLLQRAFTPRAFRGELPAGLN